MPKHIRAQKKWNYKLSLPNNWANETSSSRSEIKPSQQNTIPEVLFTKCTTFFYHYTGQMKWSEGVNKPQIQTVQKKKTKGPFKQHDFCTAAPSLAATFFGTEAKAAERNHVHPTASECSFTIVPAFSTWRIKVPPLFYPWSYLRQNAAQASKTVVFLQRKLLWDQNFGHALP